MSRRLYSLDAIRGIAAMLVVMGHALEEVSVFLAHGGLVRRTIETAVVEYLNLGRIGVVAFFLLSGYVVPFSFSHHRPLPSFFITRIFRLYPAYWLSLALAIPVTLFATGALPAGSQVLANATMVQAVFGQDDLIGVYWTLFYELMFYGLCVASFLLGRMESPRYLLAVVAGFSALGMAAALLRYSGILRAIPIGIPLFMAIMHLGTLVRLSDRGDNPFATRCYSMGLAIVLLTSGPIAGIGFIQHKISETLFASVSSLYVGFALFLGLRHSRAICRPSLLFLGLISYSLYLFHPLILLPVLKVTPQVSPPVAIVLLVVAMPVGGILLAVVVQRWVEAPFNALGKTLRRRLLERA